MTATSLMAESFKKSDLFVSRRIAGEAILVPLHPKRGDADYIYSLNETASTMWESLDGSQPLQAIVAKIADEYRIDPAEAEQDLLGLVTELISIGAIQKV